MFKKSKELRSFRRARFVLSLVANFGGFLSTARAANVPDADLFGTVRDPQGIGVANVSVALLPPEGVPTLVTTTDTSGHFEFREVLSGRYWLTAGAPGFADVSNEIELVADKSTQADLQFSFLCAGRRS